MGAVAADEQVKLSAAATATGFRKSGDQFLTRGRTGLFYVPGQECYLVYQLRNLDRQHDHNHTIEVTISGGARELDELSITRGAVVFLKPTKDSGSWGWVKVYQQGVSGYVKLPVELLSLGTHDWHFYIDDEPAGGGMFQVLPRLPAGVDSIRSALRSFPVTVEGLQGGPQATEAEGMLLEGCVLLSAQFFRHLGLSLSWDSASGVVFVCRPVDEQLGPVEQLQLARLPVAGEQWMVLRAGYDCLLTGGAPGLASEMLGLVIPQIDAQNYLPVRQVLEFFFPDTTLSYGASGDLRIGLGPECAATWADPGPLGTAFDCPLWTQTVLAAGLLVGDEDEADAAPPEP